MKQYRLKSASDPSKSLKNKDRSFAEFDTPEEALAWLESKGLPRDFAVLSTEHIDKINRINEGMNEDILANRKAIYESENPWLSTFYQTAAPSGYEESMKTGSMAPNIGDVKDVGPLLAGAVVGAGGMGLTSKLATKLVPKVVGGVASGVASKGAEDIVKSYVGEEVGGLSSYIPSAVIGGAGEAIQAAGPLAKAKLASLIKETNIQNVAGGGSTLNLPKLAFEGGDKSQVMNMLKNNIDDLKSQRDNFVNAKAVKGITKETRDKIHAEIVNLNAAISNAVDELDKVKKNDWLALSKASELQAARMEGSQPLNLKDYSTMTLDKSISPSQTADINENILELRDNAKTLAKIKNKDESLINVKGLKGLTRIPEPKELYAGKKFGIPFQSVPRLQGGSLGLSDYLGNK